MPQNPLPSIPVTLENWQKLGRYSFRHVNKIINVKEIPNAGPTVPLAEAPVPRLDEVKVRMEGTSATPTVREIIDATETDGWLVLHDDQVVIEERPGKQPHPDEYPGKMPADTRHLLMSVTKSLTGTVAGILEYMETEKSGKVLDTDLLVTDYVGDQGADWGYNGAKVRDVLDMRSAIEFSEEYLDETSTVAKMERASGWAPLISGDKDNVKEFLKDLREDQGRTHGGPFTYRSCETAVLGWVCEEAYHKAMGGPFKPFWELVSELLWSKLGASDSGAYVTVDSEETSAFDGGICATLHDLARFGAMICRGGKSLTGDQVVDPAWVDGIFAGGADSAQAFRDDPHYPELGMLDGKFRNMFWSRTSDPDVVLCIGVYGQLVYINRRTQVVGVKFSSWPTPKETDWNGTWKGSSAVSMFEAISAYLP